MARIESRVGTSLFDVRPIEVRVTGADKCRFRIRIDGVAPGVSHLELKTTTHSLFPFGLKPVVVAPGAISDQQVGGKETVGSPLVGAWESDADLVDADGHSHRTLRGSGN